MIVVHSLFARYIVTVVGCASHQSMVDRISESPRSGGASRPPIVGIGLELTRIAAASRSRRQPYAIVTLDCSWRFFPNDLVGILPIYRCHFLSHYPDVEVVIDRIHRKSK